MRMHNAAYFKNVLNDRFRSLTLVLHYFEYSRIVHNMKHENGNTVFVHFLVR